jgi:hypothetical protein
MAGWKTTYTPDGHRKYVWIEGYVRPEIEYAQKTAPNGTMSDEEYLKAHKAELRALLEKSQGTEARAARFPKELDKGANYSRSL